MVYKTLVVTAQLRQVRTAEWSKESSIEYKQDIASVFRHTLDAMPKGNPIIVIAADKANVYSDIAKLANVEVEDVLERHVNRRTGRRSSEFFESIFIWRKR